jgi:hypothetical protein
MDYQYTETTSPTKHLYANITSISGREILIRHSGEGRNPERSHINKFQGTGLRR